jgi:hypothetical protein
MALGVEDVLEENRLDYMHTVVKVVFDRRPSKACRVRPCL